MGVAAVCCLWPGLRHPPSAVETSRQPMPIFYPEQFEGATGGDLILIRGRHWRSRAVQTLRRREAFTHIGILVEQNDGLWVVHASPEAETEGVAVETLEDFLKSPHLRAVRVRRLGEGLPQMRNAASLAALEMGGQGLPFDGNFDLDSEDRIYCSELIWRAYCAVGVDLLEGIDWQERIPLLENPILMPSIFSNHPQFDTVLDLPEP